MADIEITLSDQNYSEIKNLVEEGEFLNWEQATEELLSMGVSSYTVDDHEPDVEVEEFFGTTTDEQQDPALQDDQNTDKRTF